MIWWSRVGFKNRTALGLKGKKPLVGGFGFMKLLRKVGRVFGAWVGNCLFVATKSGDFAELGWGLTIL